MIEADKMTPAEREKLTRQIEQETVPEDKPRGLVSVIAACWREKRRKKPKYSISEINRMAEARGISYGMMVLELQKGQEK